MTSAAAQSAPPAPPQPSTTATLRTIDLGKTIEDRPILSSISIEARPATLTALLGANGAGKST
ncbi:MAG: hypothetical protein KDA21_05060, partial [Phycisphaerales bacterium]|nr:hypothetical protein [Phycisphaerales bacterium]